MPATITLPQSTTKKGTSLPIEAILSATPGTLFKNWKALCIGFGWDSDMSSGAKVSARKLLDLNWEYKKAGHFIQLVRRKTEVSADQTIVNGAIVPMRKIREGTKYLINTCHLLLQRLEEDIPETLGETEVTVTYLSVLEVAELVGIVNSNYKARDREVTGTGTASKSIKFFNIESYNKLDSILKGSFRHLKSRNALKLDDTFLVTLQRENGNKPVQREATNSEATRIIEIKKAVLAERGISTEAFIYTTPLVNAYLTRVSQLVKEELGITSYRKVKKFSYSRAIKLSVRLYKRELHKASLILETNRQVLDDLRKKVDLYLEDGADNASVLVGNGVSLDTQFKEIRDYIEELLSNNIKVTAE